MDELCSLDIYEAEYPNLARALGPGGAVPAAGEIEFLREVTEPGRFPFGLLSQADALFVAGVTSILRPRAALEIGTASGFSTAIIAKMIALRRVESGAELDGVFVHTIDLKEHVRGNIDEPIGFGLDLVAPEVRRHVAVHTPKDSSCARELFGRGELSFAFIDGNHQHPWPVHDVVQSAAVMAAGSWIVMHDVDLATRIETERAAGQVVSYEARFGAAHVFQFWPGDKIRAGNIAAVKLPEPGGLKELLDRLRGLPSETSPNTWRRLWREIDQVAKKLA